jgi:hypothetical protein
MLKGSLAPLTPFSHALNVYYASHPFMSISSLYYYLLHASSNYTRDKAALLIIQMLLPIVAEHY